MNIILKLKGGIGNQLFQLAAGLSIAKCTGRSLIADESSFGRDSYNRQSVLKLLFPEIQADYTSLRMA